MTIDKATVAEHLRAAGYDAEYIDGVVVVWTDTPEELHRKKEPVRKCLRAIGYTGSWSLRVKRIKEGEE